MLLYFFKKYFFGKSIVMSAMFFSISINAMDVEVVSPIQMFFSAYKVVADALILHRLDLQSIGRFARVCKTFQPCAFDKIYSTLPEDSACFSDFANSYPRCTKDLIYFAKQQNEELFQFLWKYHQVQREEEIQTFLNGKLDEISWTIRMNLYRDSYIEIAKKTKKKNKKIEKLNSQKEWKQKQRLRDKLYFHVPGAVKELRDQNIDIAALYPDKNESQLFYILCKNTDDPDLLTFLAGEYITAHSHEAAQYLLKCRRFFALLTFIRNGIYDINMQFKSGKTILHCLNDGCCVAGNLFFVQHRCGGDPFNDIDQAITMGADVHAVDSKGRTCLHYACKSLHVKTVKRLLQDDTLDINKKDKKGKKPVDYIDWLSSYYDDNTETDKKIIRLLLKSYVPKQK